MRVGPDYETANEVESIVLLLEADRTVIACRNRGSQANSQSVGS